MSCSAPNGQCVNHGACNMNDGCIYPSGNLNKSERPLPPEKLVRPKKKKK